MGRKLTDYTNQKIGSLTALKLLDKRNKIG